MSPTCGTRDWRWLRALGNSSWHSVIQLLHLPHRPHPNPALRAVTAPAGKPWGPGESSIFHPSALLCPKTAGVPGQGTSWCSFTPYLPPTAFPLSRCPVLGTREGAAAILTQGSLLQQPFILHFSNRNGDRASPRKRRGVSVSHTSLDPGCRAGSGMGSTTHLVSTSAQVLPRAASFPPPGIPRRQRHSGSLPSPGAIPDHPWEQPWKGGSHLGALRDSLKFGSPRWLLTLTQAG